MQAENNKSSDCSGFSAPFLVALAFLVGLAGCEPVPEPPPPAPESSVVVYEGARLIVGDGSAPIENGAFSVDEGQIVEVGAAGAIAVPEGRVARPAWTCPA